MRLHESANGGNSGVSFFQKVLKSHEELLFLVLNMCMCNVAHDIIFFSAVWHIFGLLQMMIIKCYEWMKKALRRVSIRSAEKRKSCWKTPGKLLGWKFFRITSVPTPQGLSGQKAFKTLGSLNAGATRYNLSSCLSALAPPHSWPSRFRI